LGHHCPELLEFFDLGMLFEEEHCPVHHMLEHTNIAGGTNAEYDHSRRGDSFHIPDVAV
jgi:hypothetical protein